MSEVATWVMICSKIPSFPAPASGRENECLTKSEILSMGGVRVNGSYDNSECAMLDDIEKYVVTNEYVFSANDLIIPSYHTDWNRIDINSYANQYINGVYSMRTNIPWFLNSQEYIESKNGNFAISLGSTGSNYLDVMLVTHSGSNADGDFAMISLTQYLTGKILNIKVFYGK